MENNIDNIMEEIVSNCKLNTENSNLTKDETICSITKIDTDFTKMNTSEFENYFLEIGADGNPNLKSEKFITKSDYKNFVFQNRENKITELTNVLKNKCKITSIPKINEDRKNGRFYKYLEFSNIYFTKDKNTAYIEVNYHDEGIYGNGTAYILKKDNKNWKIVRSWNLWTT